LNLFYIYFILGSQIRNLTADLDQAREQLEEEQEGRADLQRQVAKLSAEVSQWRSRYESEGNFHNQSKITFDNYFF
jgi:predicted  nucleic acid-binding Zn-ribbon protein